MTSCARSTSGAPVTTSARAPTGWPANSGRTATPHVAIWSGAIPIDREPRDRTRPHHRSCRWCARFGAGPSDSGAIWPWPPTSRVAADDAVFWEPFVDRGFSPDSGSTWLLPRLVGVARAKRMLLLGEKVERNRCRRLGHDPQAVGCRGRRRRRRELLDRLATGPTVAIGLAKQASARRPARHAGPGDDPGAVQPRTLLPDSGFQRGSGRVPGTTHAGLHRPMIEGNA